MSKKRYINLTPYIKIFLNDKEVVNEPKTIKIKKIINGTNIMILQMKFLEVLL